MFLTTEYDSKQVLDAMITILLWSKTDDSSTSFKDVHFEF